MVNIPIDDVLEKIPANTAEEKKTENKIDEAESDDFDELLKQLNSDTARINALLVAYSAQVDLKKHNLVKVFDYYYQKNDFWSAGTVAEKYDLDEAINVYAKGSYYSDIARIYEKKGDLNMAIAFYIRAANERYGNKKYFYHAGEMSKKIGNISEAINYFEKSEIEEGYYEAAELCEQKKEYDKALILYNRAQKNDEYTRLRNSKEYKTYLMIDAEEKSNFQYAHQLAVEIDDKEKMKLYKSLFKIIHKQDVEKNK